MAKWEGLFLNKRYLCCTYDTGSFRGRLWEGLFVKFLWAFKRDAETSTSEPHPVWPSSCDPCFRQFSYKYWNTVLWMVMVQNWDYESRIAVIISNQSYWTYHSFLSALRDLLSFSVPWGHKKFLGCCLLTGISTHKATMLLCQQLERYIEMRKQLNISFYVLWKKLKVVEKNDCVTVLL